MASGKLEIVTHQKEQRSLDDMWKMWVVLRGALAPQTLNIIQGVKNKFFPHIEGKEITMETMLAWSVMLRESKLSVTTINKLNKWLRPFLRWLLLVKYIDVDVTPALPCLLEPPPKEPPTWSQADYEKLKEWCRERPWCQPHLWLIILSYRTGMTLKDCCYLRWRDVHLHEDGPSYIDYYRIKTVKMGNRARCQIPILPGSDIHKWLLKLKAIEHLNYKRFDGITDFVHQDCPGLFECTFWRIRQDFKYIFLKAKIDTSDGKRFKHLRNSFCSNLVNSGANHALICKMTGHNNMKTLLLYLKPDRAALQGSLANAFAYAENTAPKRIKIVDSTTAATDKPAPVTPGPTDNAV